MLKVLEWVLEGDEDASEELPEREDEIDTEALVVEDTEWETERLPSVCVDDGVGCDVDALNDWDDTVDDIERDRVPSEAVGDRESVGDLESVLADIVADNDTL
jgi:hypothetical protein